MKYQKEKERRIGIFEDTIRLCEREQFLTQAIFATQKKTRMYKAPLEELDRPEPSEGNCQITVSARRTLEAAYGLAGEYPNSRIGALNFASATNPGGGVIRGSNAQEECICRCTTLYPCLNVDKLRKGYYNVHRQRHSALYTNACIYTPDIVCIKSDTAWPELLPKEQWLTLDMISCAAPNLRARSFSNMNLLAGDAVDITDEALEELLTERVKGIFQVATCHGIDVLVLGAFGCGAFWNPPEVAAKAFVAALEEYHAYFQAVEFAVYCSPKDMHNYNVFREVFSPLEP